jgi:hypothetical protein
MHFSLLAVSHDSGLVNRAASSNSDHDVGILTSIFNYNLVIKSDKFETTILVDHRPLILNVSLAAGFGVILPNFGLT